MADLEEVVAAGGVGARVRRKEDRRFRLGRGQFVGDLKIAGMKDVAFVRSPVAHGRLRGIEVPPERAGSVFTAKDLAGVKAIRAITTLPGFKASEQPPLVRDKIRQVGELVAMCVADSRAQAEDIAGEVILDIDELPAVVDMLAAHAPDSPLVHEEWGDNVFLETFVLDDKIADVVRNAPVRITRTLRTARQCMAPLEGRGLVAQWEERKGQLVVHSSTQLPHIDRTGLAECLGLGQHQVRVIAPDVGGGFGYKGILTAESVAVCWLAMKLRRPIRWIEDRREHLGANADCREHHYQMTLCADHDGRFLGLDAEVHVDAGCYSVYPFSACLEGGQVASILPGPYVWPAYQCKTWSMATNKPPILPYRGVARAGVCYALEVMIDALAREIGKPAHEIRLLNLVPPEAMPYDNVTKKHFDSGDYPQAMRRAVKAIDIDAVRARQKKGEADGRLIGVGLSIFCEQAAHGTSVYSSWGVPMIPGFEQAVARMTPDGGLELRVGIQSHGQGLETTLAQLGTEILGVPVDRISVVHGDTEYTPYSTGTWGSRCMVMAGGAVAQACTELGERLRQIGAGLLQVAPERVRLEKGRVVADSGGSISVTKIADTWYLKPQNLPAGVNPGGLEITAGYKTKRDSGTFSYAAHAVVVAVDPAIGDVEILDYAIVEDGGVLINPLVVDGQVYGGMAQGIGTALYEEMPFDETGQPLASTLADYLLPGATEVPNARIDHMETPSPYSFFGQKGLGEGGAIGPPAAIANAVNDALAQIGVELTEIPLSPRRILSAIAAKEAGGELAR